MPVLQLLETPEASNDFYQSYVLLLWLSIIVYMPFNMAAFDRSAQGRENTGPTVVQRWVLGTTYLSMLHTSRGHCCVGELDNTY